jgi:dihydroneopterin aldolase
VDLKVQANLQTSAKSDKLSETVDYVLLNRIVREEMAQPSYLLETVAKRILNRIFIEDALVTKACVYVSKLNPPIGGDVERVTIKMSESRKNAV